MEHRLKHDADSQPAAPATASEPSREDRRAEALATRRVAQTRAMTWTAAVIGAGIFLSFGAVDVALHAVLYPEGSLLAALV